MNSSLNRRDTLIIWSPENSLNAIMASIVNVWSWLLGISTRNKISSILGRVWQPQSLPMWFSLVRKCFSSPCVFIWLQQLMHYLASLNKSQHTFIWFYNSKTFDFLHQTLWSSMHFHLSFNEYMVWIVLRTLKNSNISLSFNILMVCTILLTFRTQI